MATPSWIGKKLSGRYQIQDMLGQGGMSSVYRAEDPNLHRTVAVKMIHPHLSADQSFISRFEAEAASVAQLRHPNIIQVYDFSNDDDTYYMVLEFVPGETLADHLKRLHQSGREMAIEDSIKYTANICDALDYAHTRGLIHRDIKPANIMLAVHGQAILMDFGISKIVGGTQHTATGAVVGTALYMAPEIIKAEPADQRADIYSLGVTLFESLTGQPPFQADSAMTLLMMHVNDPVPDMRKIKPDVPAGLVQVVEKALAKNKEDRYQTAAEFANALRGIDLSQPTQAGLGATMADVTPDGVYETRMEDLSAAPSLAGTSVETPNTVRSAPVNRAAYTQKSQGPAAYPPPASTTGGYAPMPEARKKKSGMLLPILIVGGIIGVFLLAGIAFFGARAFGLFASQPTPTLEAPTIMATEPLVEPLATNTVEPTLTSASVVNPDTPTETPEPTLMPTATNPSGPYVRINSITVDNGYYIVDYETFGYTEELPGVHIHFFFNNITPENAGSGGSGPWYLWGGPRPFDGYAVSDKPADATQICALQANANHTINLNTGNCVDLP